MSVLRKKLLSFLAASAIVACAAIQPVSAQDSGIGSDGFTRLLWRGTDSRISLWRCNQVLIGCVDHQYGPFPGWLPIAITTANNNNSYVLWRNTDGTANVWLVDANLNFAAYAVYGPFSGWIAESLSADTNGNSTLRLIWRHTTGVASIWFVQPNLSVSLTQQYGPFFGFVLGDSVAGDASSAAADEKAAAAMADKKQK